MLYWLLVPLRDSVSFFNLFRYITVRTALAGITAMLLTLRLRARSSSALCGRTRSARRSGPNGPQSHLAKKGTPSMGGILIIGATIIPTLLWGNLGNSYVWLGDGDDGRSSA